MITLYIKMLFPKKTKFKKYRKRFIKSKINLINPNFKFIKKTKSKFIFIAVNNGIMDYKQIETIRRVITRKIKKIGRLWFSIFADIPVTTKPKEVRMGSGKGKVSNWVIPIRAGTIILEIENISQITAFILLKLINSKLPIKIKLLIS